MSMSDSDYSDCESDDEVPPNFTHGKSVIIKLDCYIISDLNCYNFVVQIPEYVQLYNTKDKACL